MKTMQEEWKIFRDLCYPNGIEGEQNKQLHQAFFAGALSILGAFDEIARTPDGTGEDVRAYDKLRQEVMQICTMRVKSVEARN